MAGKILLHMVWVLSQKVVSVFAFLIRIFNICVLVRGKLPLMCVFGLGLVKVR